MEIELPESNNKYGYTSEELAKILDDNPNIKEDKFWNALRGVTCMMNSEGKALIYHCDVELAVTCGLENRDMTSDEWD